MGRPIDMERNGYELIGCYVYFLILSYNPDLRFSRSNFKNVVSGMGGPIGMEPKGWESIGC